MDITQIRTKKYKKGSLLQDESTFILFLSTLKLLKKTIYFLKIYTDSKCIMEKCIYVNPIQMELDSGSIV